MDVGDGVVEKIDDFVDDSTGERRDVVHAEGVDEDEVYPDGIDGIDNSFGKLIFPIMLAISPDASTKINASFANGSSTVMFDLRSSAPEPTTTPS